MMKQSLSRPIQMEHVLASPEERIKKSIGILRDPAAGVSMLLAACKVMAQKHTSVSTRTMHNENRIEAVCNLLRRPGVSIKLVEQACLSLGNMLTSDDCDAGSSLRKAAAGSARRCGSVSVEAVIAVLGRDDAGECLLEQACRVLANITEDEAENKKAAGCLGGVVAVIELFERVGSEDCLLESFGKRNTKRY